MPKNTGGDSSEFTYRLLHLIQPSLLSIFYATKAILAIEIQTLVRTGQTVREMETKSRQLRWYTAGLTPNPGASI